MKKNVILSLLVASTVCFASHSNPVSAAGFALIEQGVKGLGNAYAGNAAAAEDATTVFFNPAGMIRLKGTQVSVAGHVIMPSAKFSNGNSVVGAAALTGGDGGDGGEDGFVPNFYYVTEIGSGLKFGLGVNAPFGLATEYDSDWKGRYHAVRSDLKTININPSVAYQVTSQLSLGAGISAQYAEAELTNAADLRRIATGGVSTAQDGDAIAKVEGDDWGYGFNVGLLYDFDTVTRLGVAYRSKVEQNLQGSATFTPTNATATALLAAIRAGGNLVDTSVKALVNLPETLSVSVFHNLNDQWALLADITRTRWSRFKELRVDYDSVQADTVIPENWKDVNRYSVGATYAPGSAWVYRAGIAYDESPVPSAEFRTPRIPDNDRKWLAIGASYASSKSFSVDLGYAHLFVSDTPINNATSLGHTLNGTYQNKVDILSAQLNWVF